MLSERKLVSGIQFEAKFHTDVPIPEYSLQYVLKYSSFEKKWNEDNIKKQDHVSKPCVVEYNYMAEKQEVSSIYQF